MAKQITLKKIIELGGFLNNNHLANSIINHLEALANRAESIGFTSSARAYRREARALFDELDRLGYWAEESKYLDYINQNINKEVQ